MDISGWRWWATVAAATIAAAAVTTAIPAGAVGPSPALVVDDGKAARSVTRLAAGEQVELMYIHSIYGAAARERFRADRGGLTMTEVVSRNDAVLDYYAVDGTRSVDADGWRTLVLAEPVHFESLPLVATPVGERTVVVRGQCYPLYTGQPGRHLSITVRRQGPRSRLASGRCPFTLTSGDAR
jgi:hypothetical protein